MFPVRSSFSLSRGTNILRVRWGSQLAAEKWKPGTRMASCQSAPVTERPGFILHKYLDFSEVIFSFHPTSPMELQ